MTPYARLLPPPLRRTPRCATARVIVRWRQLRVCAEALPTRRFAHTPCLVHQRPIADVDTAMFCCDAAMIYMLRLLFSPCYISHFRRHL